MSDLRERINDSAASDLWDVQPDWLMLAVTVALVVGWLVWFAVIIYRLLATN
jgi:hypothetical protein